MNEFNEEQKQVIESLARSFHQKLFSNSAMNDIPREVQLKLEDNYAENIIKGLIDPDHWKDLTDRASS